MFLISIGKQRQEARTQEQPDSKKTEYKKEELPHLKLVHMMASAPFSSAPVKSVVKFFSCYGSNTLLPVKSVITVAGNSIYLPRTQAREFYVTYTGTFISVAGIKYVLCLLAQKCLA